MKKAADVLSKLKGGDTNVNKVLTGKNSFSKAGFGDLVNALVNDTSFKVTSMGKDGKPVQVNLSQLIRDDIKKTLDAAKYPQKSEAKVLDTVNVITKGLAEAIPHIVAAQMETGRKFSLPAKSSYVGDIYLTDVKGKTKTMDIRNMDTQVKTGSVTITTQDSVQVRAKSPVPKHLQKKVKKDLDGKVVQ